MAKTYAVVGASGNVGKVVAQKLKAQGHAVRPVSRAAGVSIDDVEALKKAFKDADGLFLMLPPDVQAPDLRKRQNELGEKLAQAAKTSGVRRVVFMSSVGGDMTEGTGPVLGLHDMEERLKALGLAELVILRPAYFMENHLAGAPMAARNGMIGTPLKADVKLPMIATADIGAAAAEALVADAPPASPRALLGPKDYSMVEVAKAFGAAIGKELKYVQFPYDEARKALIGMGLSASFADALIEMNTSFNEGKLKPAKRSAENTTPTALEAFARDQFKKACEAALAKAGAA